MTNDRRARASRAEQAYRERELAARRQRLALTAGAVAGVVLVVAALGWFLSRGSADEAQGPAPEIVQPRNVAVGEPIGFAFEGTVPLEAGAPSVEVYADFLCPHCADFEESTGERLRALANAGEINLRFVPMTILDGRAKQGPAHDVMNTAVCAADAAGPAAFWQVHEALFAAGYATEGERPSKDELLEVAREAGVGGLDECVAQGRFVGWLDVPREAARDRGVTGTPSVFVDGTKVEDPTTKKVEAAIDAA